jgi:branched-chain amino acid transport system substrate-binding protein
MKHRSVLTAAILLVCCLTALADRTTPGAVDLSSQIQSAESLYERSEYTTAAELFSELAVLNPYFDRISHLQIMEAKSRYYAGEHERAAPLFERIIADGKSPSYDPACYYFLGRIAFDRDDYPESAEHFVRAFVLTSDSELKNICYSNCLSLCIGYLSFSEQKSMLTASYQADQKLFSDLVYNTAKKYYEIGLHRQAERIVGIHSACVGDGDSQIRNLENEISLGLSRSLDIALLVPLSGELAAYGRQMDAAAELAVITYGKPDTDIRIKSYDTHGNSIVSAQLSRDVTSSGVSAVIGPLTSQEAVGAAPYSDFWSVPMILPAASEKGLTSVSSRIFQLSPTPETMGRRLAEAAIDELGLDSIAILAPNDGYGRQITEGFKKAVGENDVDIFYEVYFPRGTSDYRRFMLSLKEAVLPDSFDPTIFLDETGDTLETEEIAVNIPTIFIPAFAEELEFIIPQLRFYRISTIILGGEDLGDPNIVSLKSMRYYPAMFISHSMFTDVDTSWQRFRYLLEEENKMTATPVAGLTFDAVRLTIEAAELGGFSSSGIARGWESLGKVDGVTGPFEFNEQNENIAVPVYIVLDGFIEKWPY